MDVVRGVFSYGNGPNERTKSMTRIVAIKQYFSTESKPVENSEIMALSKEAREELGNEALKALGETLS